MGEATLPRSRFGRVWTALGRDLGRWWTALHRGLRRTRLGTLADQAAALVFYGILSVFPGLLVLVSVLGLFGGPASDLDEVIATVAPGEVGDFLRGTINRVASSGTAGYVGFVGLLAAFWSASGYLAAFVRATAGGQAPGLRRAIPLRLALTAGVGILLIACVLIVVFTGDLAQRAGEAIGLGAAGLTAWNVVKWPVLIALVAFMLALLYRLPRVPQERPRWVTAGSVTAVLLWVVVSAAFGLYLGTLASYEQTYGALGGAIAFLVWLWLINIVVLIGARLDLELDRMGPGRSRWNEHTPGVPFTPAPPVVRRR